MSEYFEDFITCECYKPEHLIKLSFDSEVGELYAQVFLEEYPWHKRVWIGIKYIFGYKSRFGHFTEIVVHKNKRDSLYKFAKTFKDHHDHLQQNKQN